MAQFSPAISCIAYLAKGDRWSRFFSSFDDWTQDASNDECTATKITTIAVPQPYFATIEFRTWPLIAIEFAVEFRSRTGTADFEQFESLITRIFKGNEVDVRQIIDSSGAVTEEYRMKRFEFFERLESGFLTMPERVGVLWTPVQCEVTMNRLHEIGEHCTSLSAFIKECKQQCLVGDALARRVK